jgi:hypothetical protein
MPRAASPHRQPFAAPEPDAGVIEDARRRQMRHRAGVLVISMLAAAAAAIAYASGVGGPPRASASAWPAPRFAPVALPPSGQCPRSIGGRDAPKVGITLGTGPAYPVLGFPLDSPPPRPGGVVSLRQDRPRVAGRYAQKVLWAIAPNAPRLTVTAGRLRGATGDRRIPFDFGTGAQPALRLVGSATWTYQAMAILVRRPGCYEFQINGASAATTVVFEAVP